MNPRFLEIAGNLKDRSKKKLFVLCWFIILFMLELLIYFDIPYHSAQSASLAASCHPVHGLALGKKKKIESI